MDLSRIYKRMPPKLRMRWYTFRNLFFQSKILTWEEYLKRNAARPPDWDGNESLNGKILFVKHTWGIGDLLFTTPVLKELKQRYPQCRIVYITRLQEVLENNPDIDELCSEDDFFIKDSLYLKKFRNDKTCRLLNFDTELKAGINFKTDLRNHRKQINEHILRLEQKSASIINLQERAALDALKLSRSLGNRYREATVLDAYCAHGRVNPQKKTVYYYPDEQELRFARSVVESIRRYENRPVFALVPKTSTIYKDYPHWEDVLRYLDQRVHVMILGNFNDPKTGWIKYRYQTVYNMIGVFTLRQSAALMKYVDLLLSSDTGLLYIRGSFGLPALSLYGPHEPEPFLKYFPKSYGLRIDRLPNGECESGCWIDTESCKKKSDFSPCMMTLSPNTVIAKIIEICLSEGVFSPRELMPKDKTDGLSMASNRPTNGAANIAQG